MTRAVAWLRSDLRAGDNPALDFAGAGPRRLAAVAWIAGDAPGAVPRTARRAALEEALAARVGDAMAARGVPLERLDPADPEALAACCARHRAGLVAATRRVACHAGIARDAAAAGHAERAGIGFVELEDGIGPGPAPDSEGAARLRDFLAALPRAEYRRDMWVPGPDAGASSRLSVMLASGGLSAARAEAEARSAAASHARRHGGAAHPAYRSFLARLGWRQGFMAHYAAAAGAYPDRPPACDAGVLAAWAGGRTGLPLVDAAMRDVAATGWINFRLRQTVASCATNLLGLPWRAAGEALARSFDDYEPGVHWPQMALQAGALAGERGPRTINPVKQGRELDPTEAYVRGWLPELRGLPAGFAHEPWLHPSGAGMAPIVDHMAAARATRAGHAAAPAPRRAQGSLF